MASAKSVTKNPSAILTIALAMSLSLSGCNHAPTDKVVDVQITWITSRNFTSEQSALRKDMSTWFSPVRLPEPCSTRVFFKIELVERQGEEIVKTKLLDQSSKSLTSRNQNSVQRLVGAKPKFEVLQSKAAAEIADWKPPQSLLVPTSKVHVTASDVARVTAAEKPLYTYDRNNSAAGADKQLENLAADTQAFHKFLTRVLCTQPSKGPSKSHSEISLLLIDLPTAPVVGRPPSPPNQKSTLPERSPSPPIQRSSAQPSSRQPITGESSIAPQPKTIPSDTPDISRIAPANCSMAIAELVRNLENRSWENRRKPWVQMAQLMHRTDCSAEQRRTVSELCTGKVAPLVRIDLPATEGYQCPQQ